jgi:hypothetical protein
LVLPLEVLIECIGCIAVRIEVFITGAAIAQGCAIRVLAGIGYALPDLRRITVAIRVVYTPLLGHVLNPRCLNQVLAIGEEREGVFGLAIVSEDSPMPLEIPRLDRLEIFVDQAEQVE